MQANCRRDERSMMSLCYLPVHNLCKGVAVTYAPHIQAAIATNHPTFPCSPMPRKRARKSYLTRSTTFIVKLSNASRASLSGRRRTRSLASPANLRARSIVRSRPRPDCTICLAVSTSPGSVNLRRIKGPSSGESSHANKAGAVARPRTRSAPSPGLPREVGEGR